MNNSLWSLAPCRPEAEILAQELGIPLLIAQILSNRNVLSPQEAKTFLDGSLDDLHDPFLLSDMDKAVPRIQKAVHQREKILIFGDYDVDGVLSVVMLLQALRGLGAEVDYFIPERLKEGYGIKEEHINVVREKRATLVISVDCGIKALSFAERARQEGIDVIITDHHRPGDALPVVTALVNPVLRDSRYPYRKLAGVGVVFKLLQALLEREGKTSSLPHYAKLVAIGTIADVSDLRGENRLLVKHGLKGLERISNRGLKSLMDFCGLQNKRITEGDVGFRIAPRLNAAGRMGAADAAVRLFFAATEKESKELALWLDGLNSKRQSEEERIAGEALNRVKDGALQNRYKVLILGCERWHRGVIGIVASRLKDAFYRPVLLFAYEDGKAFGSGRSIGEFSLIDCLDECREIFLDYGGHTLAVGCVLPRDRVELLKRRVNGVAESRLKDEDLRRKIGIDAKIDFSDMDLRFLESFFRLAPFGVGNPRPTFLTKGVEIASSPLLLKDKHLKFLAKQNGKTFEAVGWEKGAWLPDLRKGEKFDLVYSLQSSIFLGEERLSLKVEDYKSAG